MAATLSWGLPSGRSNNNLSVRIFSRVSSLSDLDDFGNRCVVILPEAGEIVPAACEFEE